MTITTTTKVDTQPFWAAASPRTVRRGQMWIPGEIVEQDGSHFQRGPMFVEWEAPSEVSQPFPVVPVHGGTFQGTEWLDSPDGRPGSAQRFVDAGYATLVVDRPGHGRSPYHPDVVGKMGSPFSYEEGRKAFYPDDAVGHTQWPYDRADTAAESAFIAGFGPMPADLAESQGLDADRLADLLERIGPAIVVTHSASGPDGWLLAERCRDLVVTIVSIEPMGPPFAYVHGIGYLAWGITAGPLTFEPPLRSGAEVAHAAPETRRVPGLDGLPVALVTAGASPFAATAQATMDFLNHAGASVERIHLPEHGVGGNGHGLIYELNSDEAIRPVLEWLTITVGGGR